MEIFADSLRFMSNKIESEDEKLKFLNDILKIVQENVKIRRLNLSFDINISSEIEKTVEDTSSLFQAEAFIDGLVNDEIKVSFNQLSVEMIRKIRIYLEENENIIEQDKLRKAAIKLKQIIGNRA
jgi:hypothetical protein